MKVSSTYLNPKQPYKRTTTRCCARGLRDPIYVEGERKRRVFEEGYATLVSCAWLAPIVPDYVGKKRRIRVK